MWNRTSLPTASHFFMPVNMLFKLQQTRVAICASEECSDTQKPRCCCQHVLSRLMGFSLVPGAILDLIKKVSASVLCTCSPVDTGPRTTSPALANMPGSSAGAHCRMPSRRHAGLTGQSLVPAFQKVVAGDVGDVSSEIRARFGSGCSDCRCKAFALYKALMPASVFHSFLNFS